jgi:hypothetical protein
MRLRTIIFSHQPKKGSLDEPPQGLCLMPDRCMFDELAIIVKVENILDA